MLTEGIITVGFTKLPWMLDRVSFHNSPKSFQDTKLFKCPRLLKCVGDTYLTLNAGGDVQFYNTIQLDQTARIAHALNRRVLSYIKRVAKIQLPSGSGRDQS